MKFANFSDWKQQELAIEFGLRKRRELPALQSWLASNEPISESETERLKHFMRELQDRADAWNEEELKLHFIGPLFSMIDFNTSAFSLFAGRTLTAQVGDWMLSGVPDAIISAGVEEPMAPYFCLQEYKKQEPGKGDPRGQLLASMLAAHQLNRTEAPIYGAYVIGRLWFFLVLQGNEYSISPDYSAAKEDILQIYRILKALKKLVENQFITLAPAYRIEEA